MRRVLTFMPLLPHVIRTRLRALMQQAGFSMRPNATQRIASDPGSWRTATLDYGAGRLLRDAKLYEIGAGTSEIRRMLIGRELFDATQG